MAFEHPNPLLTPGFICSGNPGLPGSDIDVPPVNIVPPVISGTITVGETLSSTTGTWSGASSFAYQWKRDGANIGSATSSTYLLVSADIGTMITCQVTANGVTSAISNALGPIEDAGDFPLPADHTVSAKRVMQQVYPRPDGETNTWARHRHAYYDGVNDVEYVIPVGVSFGRPPYRYQIQTGPTGMTIGQFYGDANYGIVTWTPSSPATNATVTVRVTDQDLNTLDVTWTVTTSTDFIFADSVNGNDGTGDGTIGNPYASVAHVLMNTTATGRAYFRTGVYAGHGAINPSISPMSLMGFPGETVTFGMTGGRITGTNVPSDFFIQNITFNGGDNTVGNYRTIWLQDTGHRKVFHDLRFTNPVNGTLGDDNPTSIFSNSVVNYNQYTYIVDCTEDGRPDAGNAGSLFICYTTSDSLFERNTVTNSSAGNGSMYLKASSYRNCVRYNYIEADAASSGFAFGTGDQIDNSLASAENEYCYNTAHFTNVGFLSNAMDNVATPGQYWVYRNTFSGRVVTRNSTASNGPWLLENNVIVAYSGQPVLSFGSGDGASTTNNGTECQGADTDGILDANFLLQGTYRTNFLGLRGAEIA